MLRQMWLKMLKIFRNAKISRKYLKGYANEKTYSNIMVFHPTEDPWVSFSVPNKLKKIRLKIFKNQGAVRIHIVPGWGRGFGSQKLRSGSGFGFCFIPGSA